MSVVEKQVGEHTLDDFLDGVIYLASPESTGDNDLGGWLYRTMGDFVEELDLGKVYVTRVAFRITSKQGPDRRCAEFGWAAAVFLDNATLAAKAYVRYHGWQPTLTF